MKWSFALRLQEAEVTETSESLNTHLAIWCHWAILALLCQIIQFSLKLSGQAIILHCSLTERLFNTFFERNQYFKLKWSALSTKRTYFLDFVFDRGLYSWDSSSTPFCLLYQSNRVRKIDGRQYSAKELIVLINWKKKRDHVLIST